MSGGVNFIQGNPAIGAMHQGMQERDRQRQSLIQAEAGAQRNAMSAATAPYELRQTQAQTSRAEDDARFSRATLGDRITRSSIQATQAELTGFYESLKLLEQGDIDSARHVAEHYGQQIPEGVFQNRALQRQLSIIADQAQTQYPNNPRKQQEYIQHAVQGLQDEETGQQRMTDPFYPYMVPNAPQVDDGSYGGAGVGNSVFDRKYAIALQLGYEPGDAFDIARGARHMTENEMRQRATAQVNMEFSGAFNVRPEQRSARFEQIMNELRENFSAPQPVQRNDTPAQDGGFFDRRFNEGQGWDHQGAESRLGQIGTDMQGVEPAPRDPSQRVVGRRYQAPDGRIIIWRGDGWEQVE